MALAENRRNRVAAWYERTNRPGMALVVLVCLLYGPSLLGGFMLDDLRNLRICRAYHGGARQSLGLYRFLTSREDTRRAREAGWFPWWVADDLRYQHLRPVSERLLYWQYLAFGSRAAGYRVIGVGLYALGVVLVLRLFRLVSGDERFARWGALLFAVAACHAVPVTFISSQCDVNALVLSGGMILLTGAFVRDGRAWRLALAVLLYGIGLGAKEAVLPVAVLPVCLGLVFRGRRGVWRRSLVAAAGLTAAGLAWVAVYLAGGYGSNTAMMLDPFHTARDYLTALPGRAVLLLTTWIVPVNPFLFRLHHDWGKWLPVYGALGAVLLVVVGAMYWRRYRSSRGVAAMALWVVSFIPLLVCTAPDDRVMMLPSIGFAFLGAAWMTQPRRDGSLRLRALPLLLFVVLQAGTALATSGFLHFMEWEAREHLRMMVAAFGREPVPGDHIFMLNTARNFEGLFPQDRLNHLRGADDVAVTVLSDIARPRVEVVDEWTLRLEAPDAPFFSSFVGLMGTRRDQPRCEGDVSGTGEVEGSIVRVENGVVTAVELRFRRRITSDSYRFIWSDADKPPVPWRPSEHLAGGREPVTVGCGAGRLWHRRPAGEDTGPGTCTTSFFARGRGFRPQSWNPMLDT